MESNSDITILLVEDEPHTRRSMSHLLYRLGYTTREAINALEAQALVEDCEPDIAIVDIELPGLRGDEWALFLRELCPSTRIIFVSGRPGLAGMDRYGPDVQYLHKPIDPVELICLIETPLASSAPRL